MPILKFIEYLINILNSINHENTKPIILFGIYISIVCFNFTAIAKLSLVGNSCDILSLLWFIEIDPSINVLFFRSKDVKIDFESDSQPLLQKGCESQIEKKPIELQMLGANPNEMDLLHGTSSNKKTKQGDLKTDGPTEISPRKIQKEGQLSNLNDEGLKTDSLPEQPQDHPISVTAQLINQSKYVSFLKA